MGMAYKTQESAEALWVIRDKVQFMGEVPEMGLSVLEVTVPPGSGTPPHKHQSIEIFRVVSGEITFTLFDAA
ncbi:cupin domain-containing protein, partial [Pseudomonas sp. BGM005]|nr:cupin domain-containing protein [Pseudomonas sp. BG5]